MPKIKLIQARNFLKNIKNTDDISIIFHDDLDGLLSAIIFYRYCKKKKAKIRIIPFSRKYDKQKISKKSNKIIIADLAPSRIKDFLEKNKNKEIFYTDHHIKDTSIPKEILEYRTKSEISSSKTAYKLCNGQEWLKIMSEMSDAGWKNKENKKEIEKFLNKNNISFKTLMEEYEYKITRTITYFQNNLIKAFKILNKIKNLDNIRKLNKYSNKIGLEIKNFVNNFDKNKEKIGKINFYFFEPKYQIKSAVINEISFSNPKEIFIFAVPKKDEISLSARNQEGNNDMVKLLKKGIKKIENSSAGGHKRACGGKIPKEKLEQFKQNLLK